MPKMNYTRSNLAINWNFKYVHTTVSHSATSTGFEYLLWHDVPVILMYPKVRLQNIIHCKFKGSANHMTTALTFLITL
jgi:hypothetical protein